MKKIQLLAALLPVNFIISAQPCTISITGDTCRGRTIKAVANRSDLKTLAWYQDTLPLTVRTKHGFSAEGTLVAGGNEIGNSKDQFYTPKSVIADEAGNVYVSDYHNQFVTRWSPGDTTGTIVAGGNGYGSNTNQLANPQGIALDKKGNLYVADGGNSRIVKWKPDATEGIVIADGFQDLFDVFIDDDNNFYALYNETIVKRDFKTGQKTIVAGGNGSGSGLNQFNAAEAIYVDQAGDIYVADKDNHRIMKWVPGATTGHIVAGGNGNGDAPDKLNYPEDVYVDKKGNVYVADSYNQRVQVWKPGARYGVTVAGGYGSDTTQKHLDRPVSLNVNDSGNLYVLESYNERVLKFSPSDTINNEFVPENMGNYYVRASFENGCSALSASFYVNDIPYNSGYIYGPVFNICGMDTFTYKTYAERATSFIWYVPAGMYIISGQGTDSIAAVNHHFRRGEIGVDAINSCGIRGVGSELTRLPEKPGYIQGPAEVRAGQTGIVYYLRHPGKGVIYTWSFPDGVSIVSGQGTGTVTVNWGNQSGYIAIFAKNDCGNQAEPRQGYVEVIMSMLISMNDRKRGATGY